MPSEYIPENEGQPDALDEAAKALDGVEPAAEQGPQDAGNPPPMDSIKQAAVALNLKVGRECDTENPWTDLIDAIVTCEEQFSDADDLSLTIVFKYTRNDRPLR